MSFQFKRFVIDDTSCAMKVGTDGVLLGAWAQIGGARRVLDVGTGSGLVAVMLAQRFPRAEITGMDIDGDAARQAGCNMGRSPWAERLSAVCCDFLQWRGEADAIVCNPPYFARSLKCPDTGRTLARHDDTLPLAQLAAHASRVLRQGGVLAVILPADAPFSPPGLSLRRACAVRTTAAKPPKRRMLEFVKGYAAVPMEEELVLDEDGQRTAAYRKLTESFYLR